MTDYQALAKEATASDIFKLENEINKLEITIGALKDIIANQAKEIEDLNADKVALVAFAEYWKTEYFALKNIL